MRVYFVGLFPFKNPQIRLDLRGTKLMSEFIGACWKAKCFCKDGLSVAKSPGYDFLHFSSPGPTGTPWPTWLLCKDMQGLCTQPPATPPPESRAPSYLPTGTQDKPRAQPRAWIHPVKQNPLIHYRIFYRYRSNCLKTHDDHHHFLYTHGAIYALGSRHWCTVYGAF